MTTSTARKSGCETTFGPRQGSEDANLIGRQPAATGCVVPRNPEVDHLPAVNPRDPASMLSLPQWADTLVHAISKTAEGGLPWGRTPTIPASLMLTGTQRTAIEARCSELEALGRPGPDTQTAKVIGGLLAFYATGRTGETSADVKLRAYMLAVEDLPYWAVAEAIRRWFRGECGAQNYDFAPAPAVLRSAASDVSRLARGQIVVLRRILAAQPEAAPPDDAELARMGKHWAIVKVEIERAAARMDMRNAGRDPSASPSTSDQHSEAA